MFGPSGNTISAVEWLWLVPVKSSLLSESGISRGERKRNAQLF